MLVDSHCHLDFPDFAPDLGEVMERAQVANVGAMLTIGTRLSQFDGVLTVAEQYNNVFCSVGVHPHEAALEGLDEAKTLLRLVRHPKVVGIGETGLDYHYEHSPQDAQERNFRTHIAAARKSGLPLIVHSREADEHMAHILTQEMAMGAFTGVMHCFSSSAQLAETALDLGFYISLSGIITFKKADELRDIARHLPLERLLVETDAPYLAPIPNRGKRNEPAFVTHTAACLAKLKGLSEVQLAETTTNNFFQLFTKATRSVLTECA